ncbi:uncharacterized protein EURHEDRAFT_410803 [Aspergillus ruber CBS 135680]|uniref:Uncharacterized protein n=1 Tax=Aspergillus ruber (strain CBS 135680) TaxID=1388766 RepID=A0A017SJ89_ASPRC|nr:uncharacterized protein EURHEDRAFT_410803 [Aspergillus ruber CBS 135680]EYE97003.1 hypothetical protein EURHEDRAFT_410803 [Aspergillus ruber CBS 135680]
MPQLPDVYSSSLYEVDTIDTSPCLPLTDRLVLSSILEPSKSQQTADSLVDSEG